MSADDYTIPDGEFEVDYSGNNFTDNATPEDIAAMPGTEATYYGERVEVLAAWLVEPRRQPEGALVAELDLPRQERQVIRLRLRRRACTGSPTSAGR